jgi:RNA polymerase sigma-70 factor (ECF subfamily)
LFRILRNTFINRYRAARVRPEEVEFDKVELAYDKLVDRQFIDTHQPPSPEKLVLDGVLDEEVEKAMIALPEEYRTVVIMALVEELSYKEIAAALSIPLGTVMSRLHRGRKQLQAALVEYAQRRGIIRPGPGVPTSEDGNS